MEGLSHINDHIARLTIPYKDIFTTVYVVKTEQGAVLFDAASYDEDATDYILPVLAELGIRPDELKYIVISHNHPDHAGALNGLRPHCTNAKVIAYSTTIGQEYPGWQIVVPQTGERILDVLEVVPIPGHTLDGIALLDLRTRTMLTGDCLQLFGIFGSGDWCANVSYPLEYRQAIDALRGMDIQEILTAHDYHPYGYHYVGQRAVQDALDACIAPLRELRDLIVANPELDDEQIRARFNASGTRPRVGPCTVATMRSCDF